ncbi:MAG: hypothetical protein WCH62_04115 [Candidatus Omnitrophota bacterium]
MTINDLLDVLVADVRKEIDLWAGNGCADYCPDDTWDIIDDKFQKIGGKVPARFSNKNVKEGFNNRLTISFPRMHKLKINFYFDMRWYDYHDEPYWTLEDADISYEYSENDLISFHNLLSNMVILDKLSA